MVHWYFDEKVAIERMREVRRLADRAQALGLLPSRRDTWRGRLGRILVWLGCRIQRRETVHRASLAAPSQCGLR